MLVEFQECERGFPLLGVKVVSDLGKYRPIVSSTYKPKYSLTVGTGT